MGWGLKLKNVEKKMSEYMSIGWVSLSLAKYVKLKFIKNNWHKTPVTSISPEIHPYYGFKVSCPCELMLIFCCGANDVIKTRSSNSQKEKTKKNGGHLGVIYPCIARYGILLWCNQLLYVSLRGRCNNVQPIVDWNTKWWYIGIRRQIIFGHHTWLLIISPESCGMCVISHYLVL